MVLEASEVFVVLVTVANQDGAVKIAKNIVKEKLAACVNIIPGVRSIYMWQGDVCDDQEVLMIIKTSRLAFPKLENRIKELHSYEVPEIIAISLSDGFEGYISWVLDVVG